MINPSAKHVFSLFEGAWSLRRKIIGHGVMKGKAIFKKLDKSNLLTQELFYREEGIFELNDGNKVDIHKEYLYVLENDQLGVYFFENNKRGQLFHILNFVKNENKKQISATAIHHCCQDIYNVKYDIYSTNKFQIIYKVNGPTKDYISGTYFKRLN